jgi:DNA-binding NarL/FixJ family response regulator
MIRVLVVDDHAVVREGLKRIIEEVPGMSVGGEASTAHEALEQVRAKPWDVVVLDIVLPGRSGLEIIKEIKHEHPTLPVLVLSMHSEDQYAIRALKEGASGYLTKESAPEQLVQAITTVVSGRKYISPSVAELLALEVTGESEQLPHTKLSSREHEVMRLLASGHSVTQIAERLSLSSKTVSTYRTRILEKMHLENNAQLVQYALRHQLVS